nr:transcription antitermination factor NusB [Motiliproteus coralliicola]
MSDSDKPQKKAKKSGKPSRTQMKREARSFALQALYQWHMAGNPLNDIEAQFRVENDMSGTDLKLFSALLHGVPSKTTELDEAVKPYLDRKQDELDPIELTVLRMGTFELAEMIDVPYKVAINEAVNLAKTFGATDSHKYVNGVLDRVARDLRKAETGAKG